MIAQTFAFAHAQRVKNRQPKPNPQIDCPMKSISTHAAVCLIGCVLISLIGCGRDSVDAVPRTSAFKPEFGAEIPEAASPNANELDLSFVHEDHFTCLYIDVGNVISSPDLADVPWETVEQELAKLVGPDNSRLAEIDRIWLLLDRESLGAMTGGQQASPMVWVLDYNGPVDGGQLGQSASKRDARKALVADDKPDSIHAFAVEKLNDQRIAMGSKKFLAKLTQENSNSQLARQLRQMELASDLEGVISLSPIRSTLQSIFDMAAQFGGESVATYARLPEVTRRIEFKLTLDEEEMIQATVFIEDDELTKEIARLVNEASTQDNSIFGGLPLGPGMLGGMDMTGQQPEPMVPSTSSTWAQEVGKEISDKSLFSVKARDQKVTFSLRRPSKLKELITASIVDAKRQFELAERAQNLQTIAVGMQKYVDEYGCFPPAGIVSDNANGLPDQFNWRVGLLPFLGEQKLYDQFDFKLAWDSDANLEVAKQIPELFKFPVSNESETNKTRIHVPGGKLGLYQPGENPKLSDISDKKIWTAAIVEGAADTAVVWTEPGQLVIDETSIEQFGVDDEAGILFVNAAFDVRIIRKNRDKLRAVLTRDGDESLARRDFMPVSVAK